MDVELIIGFMIRVFLYHKDAHGDAKMKMKLTHNNYLYNIYIGIKMIKIKLCVNLALFSDLKWSINTIFRVLSLKIIIIIAVLSSLSTVIEDQ